MTNELDRLAAARRAFADLAPTVLAGEPWPLATAFGTEPEASWGPREVLAHVAEMLPYWRGELERVVEGSPEPVPFGRLQDDTFRIGLIERDRNLPIALLFARIDAGLRDWADRVPILTPAERERRGLHPRLGDVPADRILQRHVLEHTEEHIGQLESTLASARSV
jgi:DinB family protein